MAEPQPPSEGNEEERSPSNWVRPELQAPRHAPPAGYQPDADFSLFLREIPSMAWRGKWYLAICLLVTLSLGVTYLLVATPTYEVSAQLLVKRRGSLFKEIVNIGGELRFLATQTEIMKSPAILQAALAALPDSDKKAKKAQRSMLSFDAVFALLEGDDLPEETPEERRLRKAVKALTAEPIVGTNVVAISFRSPNPKKARRIVKSVIDGYRSYVRGVEQDSHASALEVLRNREKELANELSSLETRYAEIRATSSLVGQGQQGLSIQKALLTKTVQMLTEAKTKRVELENELRVLLDHQSANASNGNGSGPNGSAPPELRKELSKVQARLAAVAHYGEKYPEVIQLRRQIEGLRLAMASSSDLRPASLKMELETARRTEQQLAVIYQSELVRSKELDTRLGEEEHLLEDIQRVEETHNSTVEMLKERELTVRALDEGEGNITIRVLEKPTAGEKVRPLPALVLVQCTLLGLIGGFGLTWISERGRRQDPWDQ